MMERKGYLPIEGNSSLSRDLSSGAVICTDPTKLKEAKERKRKLLEDKARITKLEEDVKELREGITEILKILRS